MMKWLHISDIHFNFKGFENSNARNKLITKLSELKIKVDFILITGDCLFKYGEEGVDSNDTESIISYIKQIAKCCNCSYKRVYICQGNHDVDREKSDRNSIINGIINNEIDFNDCYNKLNKLGNDKLRLIVKGVTSFDYESYKVFAPRNTNFRVVSLNSCLLSKDKEDSGKLRICNDKLSELEKQIYDDERINIVIMHHGVDFLKKRDSIQFEHWLEDNHIDVVFCGHTHRSALETYDETCRDLKQFTAGALVVDDYAIPSFYLCEYGVGYDLFINLYTYSKDSETWSLDNHSLRKFNNGVYTYKLSRIFKRMQNTNKLDVDRYTEFITKMNKMYEIKYSSRNIISNNFDGYDTFDVSKIIGSLSNINMPYEKALGIAFEVVTQITSNGFKANGDYLSCTELRHIIYQKIISQKSTKNDKEFSISCWASRYARKYNRNSEIIIQMQNNRTEKMNYAYVQNTLLKHIFDEVTGNEIFYLKTSKKELQRMSERILDFLRNMGIFEVREEVLDSLIIEYITQKPHPWLVHNNSKQLLVYHTHQAEEHINKLKRNEVSIISQTEAAYHISAAFLVQYDKVIGCTETSPISIIKNTVNGMCNEENMILNRLPMQKYQIIQLKKDLEKQSIDFKKFIAEINVVYDFIIDKQEVTNEKTKIALIDLWDMLRKLEQKNPYDNQRNKENPIERIRYIFEEGTGFIVKAPLQALKSCFWIEPNWEEYEIKQQHLGEQALVCVINSISDVDDVHKYLFPDGCEVNSRTTELIFAYNSYKSFTKEDRNAIREKFYGKAIKCIFVQEDNYSMISENQNWREVLFDVIRISRLS